MSSDNRTDAIIQQRVINTHANLRQASRKCSFCRCAGHTVNQCNDGRFMVFELACIQQKQLIHLSEVHAQSTNGEAVSPSREFINQLILYAIGNTARMIKYYAVRKCGAVMRDNIFTCIEKLSIYIFNLNDESNYLLNDTNFQSNNWYNMILNAGLLDLAIHSVLPSISTKFKIESILDLTDDNEGEIGCDSECDICYESKIQNDFVKLNCSHSFCGKCIENTLKTCTVNTGPCCALCRSTIKSILTTDVNIISGLAEYII
jgi:hypothetical protein